MKEYFDIIMGFAKGADTWQAVVVLIIIIFVIGVIVAFTLFRKHLKKLFNVILDRITDKKSNEFYLKITEHLNILTQRDKINSENVDSKKEIIFMELDNLSRKLKELKKTNYNYNEENKDQHKRLFDKVEKLNESTSFNIYVNNHNKLVTELFEKFCNKNKNLNKNLRDVLQKGVDKNKSFFSDMVIIGLENIDMPEMTENFKSLFRTLRSHPIYESLNFASKKMKLSENDLIEYNNNKLIEFKEYIDNNIAIPLITELISQLRTDKGNERNGKLIAKFSKGNLRLIEGMLYNTKIYYDNLIK